MYAYPAEERFGGPVGAIRSSVLHLRKRGHIYGIAGRSFWCFGGAFSVDKSWRTEGVSWWSEEEATEDDMAYGADSLQQSGWRVDYILPHDCPDSAPRKLFDSICLGYVLLPSRTGRYLERRARTTAAKRWHFGHHHLDFNEFNTDTCGRCRYRAVYQDILEL